MTLNAVEKTLFVPMLGRIYCSNHFPHILNDSKALELGNLIPSEIAMNAKGDQYTKIASAVRSTNMDRYIQDFMKRHSNGIIVQIGCGLETTFYRNDDGMHQWFEIDLPEVINFRRKIIGETERDICMAADATKEDWINEIRKQHPNNPLLITVSGVFYYFTEEMVLQFMKNIQKRGNAEIVFDTVNSSGMKQMHKHMKTVGHQDASIYFFVDKAEEFSSRIGARLISEEMFYTHTPLKGLSFRTKLFIRFSDWFGMVKMVHLQFT